MRIVVGLLAIFVFCTGSAFGASWGEDVIARPWVDYANQITFLNVATPAPITGSLVSWNFYSSRASNAGDSLGDFKLQLFRQVGSEYTIVAETVVPTWTAGINTIDVSGTPIAVQAGDLLGFRYNWPAYSERVIVYSEPGAGGTFQWTNWPDTYGQSSSIPVSAFAFGGGRIYSLSADLVPVTAPVPEPASALLVLVSGVPAVAMNLLRRKAG